MTTKTLADEIRELLADNEEQQAHELFEQHVGIDRGFRIMRMHTNVTTGRSDPSPWRRPGDPSPEDAFRKRALSQGYTDEEIDAFLALQ